MHKPAFIQLVEAVMPNIKEISCNDAHQAQSNGAVLIDVREDHEWQNGHAAGAQHLGKGIIERDIEKQVPDKNQQILLYCGGGYRSALAADALQKMGYSNVYSVAGGWKQWREEKMPTA